jgi:hypothetical protein
MNERIKKLAEQATTEEHDGFRYFDKAKFAELIVRECMNIADGQKKYVEDMEVFNEQDANWNRARIQQSQQIVDKIKQHFGVEL